MDNVGSQRVAEKAGLRRERVERAARVVKGEKWDVVWYGLSRPQSAARPHALRTFGLCRRSRVFGVDGRDGDERAGSVVEFAGITVDCLDVRPMIEFYAAAFGAETSHEDDSGAWIHLDGGPLILIRRVDDYRPPTWPQQDVPIQFHLELWIDDLDEAEARLQALGAVTCEFQPHRGQGNVVMLDPAGHPFCIGTRV